MICREFRHFPPKLLEIYALYDSWTMENRQPSNLHKILRRTFYKHRLSGMVYLEANEFQEKWVTKMRGFAAAAF